jgi:class 3 adenylate cyclase
LAFLVGGLWLIAASLGSLVVLAKESPRSTLRARTARALLTVFVLSVLVSLSAARWGPWLLSKLLERAPQLLEVWSDVRMLALIPAGSNGFWVSAALLLVALPAALSSSGKLMDGAAERVAALQAASEEVVEGRLDVRVDEGGTRELARLSRSYNDMLDSFTRARRIEQAFGPRTEATLGRLRMRCPDGRAPAALRTATVIVAEIRELSSLLGVASPPQAVRLLASYFDRVIATLDRHEGFLERISADSMIAVFNAPLDQDDHMIRATRCAIELLTELTAFLRSEEATGIGKFNMAIGVASGPIVTGTTDGAACRYLLAGETFELAARLASLTPSGQVWVNQRNAETLPMYIPSMMLPAVTLRGSTHPVAPYRVWPPP